MFCYLLRILKWVVNRKVLYDGGGLEYWNRQLKVNKYVFDILMRAWHSFSVFECRDWYRSRTKIDIAEKEEHRNIVFTAT